MRIQRVMIVLGLLFAMPPHALAEVSNQPEPEPEPAGYGALRGGGAASRGRRCH